MCPAAYTGDLPVYPAVEADDSVRPENSCVSGTGKTDCRASLRLARNDRLFG